MNKRDALDSAGIVETFQKRLVLLFFFISGIPALIYEILWQRALFRVFGINSQSVTIVIAAFMLGLGCGALIGSMLSERSRMPRLLLVAGMELTISVIGFWSLTLIDRVGALVYGASLTQLAAVTIGLLIVPTALMGATLPLLVDHTVATSRNVGQSTGGLYRSNTLGAVVGCLIGALVLFPFLGMQGSIDAAALLNLVAAAVALSVYLRSPPASRSVPNRKLSRSDRGLLSYPAAWVLAFLSGYISLSYEIFCIHVASFSSATSALALTIVLATFLLGISSGSSTAAELGIEENSHKIIRSMTRSLAFAAMFGACALPLLSHSNVIGAGAFVILILLTFVVSRALGMVFPITAHLTVPPEGGVGRAVGLLYTMNILGATSGTVFTGFILTNLLGLFGIAAFLSGMMVLLIGTLVVTSKTSLRDSIGYPLAALLVLTILIPNLRPQLADNLFAALLYKNQEANQPPLTDVVENRDGIIVVNSDGIVFGSGAYDGAFNVDPVHDINFIVRPYALSLVHPDPREVLMIGLSSGSWAQVVVNNPFVRHLTIVEINPGYMQLIQRNPKVASLLTNPKVTIVIDDGRRWLVNHPDREFDAIVANATFNYRLNATNLVSIDFERLISAHLRKGGVYFFNTTESLRVQRTACLAFPHGVRFLNHMLMSNDALAFDANRWRQTLENYRIDGRAMVDLARSDDRAALDKMVSLPSDETNLSVPPEAKAQESCDSLLARTGDRALVTDDSMGTEWRYPLGLGD